MHLRPDRADFLDQADDPAHLAVSLGIDQFRPVARPIGMDQHGVARRDRAPQLLGDEGHGGVQQDQALVDHPCHGGARLGDGGRVTLGQKRLGKFDIPVTDPAPDKGVKTRRRIVEAIARERLVMGDARARRFPHDPTVDRLGNACGIEPRHRLARVHLGKTRGVPKLGAEIAIARDPVFRQLQITPHRRHRGQREAHGIGAKLVDQFQRVQHIADALRHLAPLLVADEGMHIDIAERHIAHHGQLHHHHPGDPEKDDVKARHKGGGREIAIEFRRLLRPAQRADGPEARGKPGV